MEVIDGLETDGIPARPDTAVGSPTRTGHRPTGLVNRAIPISIDHPDGRVRGDESAAAIEEAPVFLAEEIEEIPGQQQIVVRLFG
jgi:hypothetical protein